MVQGVDPGEEWVDSEGAEELLLPLPWPEVDEVGKRPLLFDLSRSQLEGIAASLPWGQSLGIIIRTTRLICEENH